MLIVVINCYRDVTFLSHHEKLLPTSSLQLSSNNVCNYEETICSYTYNLLFIYLKYAEYFKP